jgi:hypothetical protein
MWAQIECCDISCREANLKASSEMEKESLKKKLETSNLLFEQIEKDFQSQKAEVLFLNSFLFIISDQKIWW